MTQWDQFRKEKPEHMFEHASEVIDIGGGLRIDATRSNRVSEDNMWVTKYFDRVSYKILDPVPDYNPDIVGDIHALPFSKDSIDAIICLAVLEHVENPFLAMQEMYRVLRPGGTLLIYVPFLYYYHAAPGYYKDYWRYTYDGLEVLARPFTKQEIVHVRLPIETLIRLTPFGRYKFPIWVGQKLDAIFYKNGSRQVSGYLLYLEK